MANGRKGRAVRPCAAPYSLSSAPPKAESPARGSALQQARDMGANVHGPVGDRRGKTRIVIAIERAQRLLIARAVAADMAHEMLGRDRKRTRLNSSHQCASRVTSSACK